MKSMITIAIMSVLINLSECGKKPPSRRSDIRMFETKITMGSEEKAFRIKVDLGRASTRIENGIRIDKAILGFLLPSGKLKPFDRAFTDGKELVNALEVHDTPKENKTVLVFRFMTSGKGPGPGNVGIAMAAGFTLSGRLLKKGKLRLGSRKKLTGKLATGAGCGIAQQRAQDDLKQNGVAAKRYSVFLSPGRTDKKSFYGFVLFNKLPVTKDPYFEFYESEADGAWSITRIK